MGSSTQTLAFEPLFSGKSGDLQSIGMELFLHQRVVLQKIKTSGVVLRLEEDASGALVWCLGSIVAEASS